MLDLETDPQGLDDPVYVVVASKTCRDFALFLFPLSAYFDGEDQDVSPEFWSFEFLYHYWKFPYETAHAAPGQVCAQYSYQQWALVEVDCIIISYSNLLVNMCI